MVRSAWSVCTALVLFSAIASAERPTRPDPAGADTLSAELPKVMPRLRLSWPFEPRRVSFNPGQPFLSANGVLQPYRFEAQWWQSGPFELKSLHHVEQSSELDCSLTCQPVMERSTGVEARLQLGSARALPETFLFAKGVSFFSPQRSGQRLTFGLGGLLDL
ncbi:MAG TPA: hypothetical protein VM686_08640 [Polyangiaceae bacterium]|nr:hypothetical protein [Polyangiaceae bacterium]